MKAPLALFCAAAAVAAYHRMASLSFAPGLSSRFAPRAARLSRASRGGEAREGRPRGNAAEIGQERFGFVATVIDSGAFVNIGTGKDGFLHSSDMGTGYVDNPSDYVKKNQKVNVWIKKFQRDGQAILTMIESEGLKCRRAHELLRSAPPDEWFTGTVTDVKSYGLFVDVSLDGATVTGLVLNGAVPGFIENMKDEFPVGKEVKVRVVKYDTQLRLSMKEPVVVGQKFKGTVVKVLDNGAKVKTGAGLGFLHISNIAEEQVDNIHDYVQQGQEVEVWVRDTNDDGGKMHLTMIEGRTDGARRLNRHWLRDVPKQEWLEGTVTGLRPYGALVEVRRSDDVAVGLVPMRFLGEEYTENVEDVVELGQQVKVRVHSHDAEGNKLLLSMIRPLRGVPSDFASFEGSEPGEWFTGKVVRTYDYGAVVSLEKDGSKANGILAKRWMTNSLRRNFQRELKQGQEVKVRIRNIDAGATTMDLSMTPAK